MTLLDIARTNKKAVILGVSILLVSSLLTIWHYDFDRLGSVPFGTRAAAFALVFNKTFSIDNYFEAAGVDYARYGGHYYSGYPPLVPVITATFLGGEQLITYSYGKVFGPINGHIAWLLESWFIALPQILSLVGISLLLYSLLQKFGVGEGVSYLSAWLLSFTSYALVYSVGANNDLPAAFLVFMAFYLLVVKSKLTSKLLFCSGLLVGLAANCEYPAVIYCIPLGVLIFLKYRKHSLRPMLLFVAGLSLPLLALAVYHTMVFGAPWHFAHQFHSMVVAPGQTAANKVDFSLLNIPTGLRGLLVSPLKGLFVYAPLSLFAFFGGRRFWHTKKAESSTALISILVVIFFYSIWWDWSGGFDFSSRYLISILPFIFLFLAFGIPTIFRMARLWLPFIIISVWGFLSTLVFTFTGIREAIRMENWTQWAALGRFESFFKVIFDNNPRDVAPILIRFGHEWPLVSNLPYSTLSIILFVVVILVALLPLILLIFTTKIPRVKSEC